MRWFLKFGPLRRAWLNLERFPPFFRVVFSRDGLVSAEGRQLIFGKCRRILISSVPPLARLLQKHYGIEGSCDSCGASCNLLFQCPHWDTKTRLCSVYDDRPNICRLFPITPADIRDRDLVNRKVGCNFAFTQPDRPLLPVPLPLAERRGRAMPALPPRSSS